MISMEKVLCAYHAKMGLPLMLFLKPVWKIKELLSIALFLEPCMQKLSLTLGNVDLVDKGARDAHTTKKLTKFGVINAVSILQDQIH